MTTTRHGAFSAPTHRTLLACVACLCVWTAASLAAQNNASDTSKLIDVLTLEPGDVVAEIGAGGGELTVAMAKHVGVTGRVYSSELGADRLTKLRDAVKRGSVTNVEVVEGQAAHANLSEGCCDAVFMRNVYHHFADPATMNASIFRALKPGARVAVIDFNPRNNAPVGPPGKRGEDSSHGVSSEVVANELKAVGFQIITSEDRGERWFLVVGEKPR
jgi:ubiquinone/menaquinone biosynthesis C-methylase UbiE